MKKTLAVFSLLVVLSVPATATPRDDDPRPRGVVDRVVHFVKRVIGIATPLDESYNPVPPKP